MRRRTTTGRVLAALLTSAWLLGGVACQTDGDEKATSESSTESKKERWRSPRSY